MKRISDEQYQSLCRMARELQQIVEEPVEDVPAVAPRCLERHAEEGQCELRYGHDGQHLAGTAIWGRP